MVSTPPDFPSDSQIEDVVRRVAQQIKENKADEAWANLQPLRDVQSRHRQSALALIGIVESGALDRERSLEILVEAHAAHGEDPEVLGLLGEALEQARDIDLLNDSPPDHPLFAAVAASLASMAKRVRNTESERVVVRGLLTAARMLARQHDALCDQSCRRLIELEPDRSNHHYNYGLFLKTRGRFREGMIQNQKAAALAREPVDSYEWNLGICATGASEGEVALQVWQRMGQKIRMGRFGLPEGGYPDCKVRLAERPLAGRTSAQDDPGLEESIWVERLSPCHGVIRSVLYQRLGVDYGDVVLFDGAPVTYHTYGENKVPVFPHLATLVRSDYQLFDFAGTQDAAGRLADVSADLERDALVYSHSESFVMLCAGCWRNADAEHDHGDKEEQHVISGRIAAPPDLNPRELIAQLDAAIGKRAPCRIFSPALCEAAGLHERAVFEGRRFEMLKNS